MEKGNVALKQRDFAMAKDCFSEAIGLDSLYGEAYLKLIGVISALKRPEEAHQLRLLYTQKLPTASIAPQVWNQLASYFFAKGAYAQADDFIRQSAKVDSLLYKSILFSLDQMQNRDSLLIRELPPQVNRYAFQYLPTLTVDNRTLIFTARSSNTSDENIVMSQFDGQKWSVADILSPAVFSRFNEGACSISADGRTLIFTSCEGRQSYGNCDLYITKKIGEDWQDPENLGRRVNSTSWDSQPTLSADGKTLYFVSNQTGGMGGRDIWVTKWEAEGWSYPKNLGALINTPLDETTPFIHSNNETLFFSSNGHVGLGGFDLFKVEINALPHKVINLGYPINTHQEEVSLVLSSDGLQAFFAKEEATGGVITSSKLVTFEVPVQKMLVSGATYVTGTIRDISSKEPIEASMEIIDLMTRERVYTTMSDAKSGRYYMVLPQNRTFGVFIEKQNYLFEDLSFATLNKASDTLDIYLQPLSKGAKMVLENIYFAFDSDELDSTSYEELARVAVLLKNHPHLKVEISGHTDNVGPKTYNVLLSERRAKQVSDALHKMGIPIGQLKYRGFGDIEPISSNSTEDGRKRNRRIQFQIL